MPLPAPFRRVPARAPGRAAIALTAAAFAACADSPVAPAAPGAARLVLLAAPRWQARARALVADAGVDPPMASRVYAVLGVAQDSAARAARAAHASVPAAVTGASAAVLSDAFPTQAAAVLAEARTMLGTTSGAEQPAAVPAGDSVGRAAAAAVVLRAADDGANLAWTGVVPSGPGLWASSTAPPTAPLRPRWGEVRPWFLSSGRALRPGPPPAVSSPQFAAALAEVRAVSDGRTERELAVATYWSDGAGSATPPGHWNDVAGELVLRYNLSDADAAGVFSLVGRAGMDAGVAVWDAKYAYWCLRPSQADPAITTPVGLPNFPAYPSGHAGFSGAAADVLGALFPAERAGLRAMAEEAAVSRVYGGIHFRFDGDTGLAIGRAVAARALSAERARRGVVPTFTARRPPYPGPA